MPEYTRNWTRKIIKNWTAHLVPLAGTRRLRFLEIGVFEGRTSAWMLENVLTGPDDRYVGIDPWELAPMSRRRFPRDGTGQRMIEEVEQRARLHLRPYGEKVTLIKGRSAEVVVAVTHAGTFCPESFTIIYVDGNHELDPCLADTVLCWPLLEVGGIMIWDDYVTRCKATGVQRAVAKFLAQHVDECAPLWSDSQFAVRKLRKAGS